MNTEKGRYALIVLGGGLVKKGESYILPRWVEERIEGAKEIYEERKGDIKKIIFSAGLSYRYSLDSLPFAEADLMKNYALSIGVPIEEVIIEKESRDTFSSAYYTRKIVDKYSIKKILIVTSDFHLPKAKLLFDFVYGDDYYLVYVGVRHQGIADSLLEKRRVWEEAVMNHFKENVFPRLKRGNLHSIANYIFNESYPFTGKQENSTLEMLREQIGDPLY